MEQPAPPVYHFETDIIVNNAQGYQQDYLDFSFEVPEGAGAVRLRLCYAPDRVGGINNLITLGVFDPRGFRGNAHRHTPHEEVCITAGYATAGFLPGPLPAGRWLAQLALQAVLPSDPPCRATLDITIDPAVPGGPVALPARLPAWEPVSAQPGWYRGELHSHTIHSDGERSFPELVADARDRGLDFLAVTDHNTLSALAETESTALDGLLLIPGMELTTFLGHAVVLGLRRWIDWRTGYDGWTMEDAARAAHAAGALFIVAHPNDIGSPRCTGCRWEYAGFNLDMADALEIWNSAWPGEEGANQKTLEQWRAMQAGPGFLPATCGADYHNLGNWGEGIPAVYVYASSLSVPAILESIRAGRLIISCGPKLGVQAFAAGGASAGVGEYLDPGEARIETNWEDAPAGARLDVRTPAGVAASVPAEGQGSRSDNLKLPPGGRIWAELFSAEGALLAITNPVLARPV